MKVLIFARIDILFYVRSYSLSNTESTSLQSGINPGLVIGVTKGSHLDA